MHGRRIHFSLLPAPEILMLVCSYYNSIILNFFFGVQFSKAPSIPSTNALHIASLLNKPSPIKCFLPFNAALVLSVFPFSFLSCSSAHFLGWVTVTVDWVDLRSVLRLVLSVLMVVLLPLLLVLCLVGCRCRCAARVSVSVRGAGVGARRGCRPDPDACDGGAALRGEAWREGYPPESCGGRPPNSLGSF